MNDSQKKLVRAFYRGLATEEEKAALRLALSLNGTKRREYLARLIALGAPINGELLEIFYESTLTREEVAAMFAEEVRRKLLARIWYWLFG